MDYSGPELKIGQRILLHSLETNSEDSEYHKPVGTVRYIGRLFHDKADRIWVGVEVDNTSYGEHDGQLGKHRYFQCSKLWPLLSNNRNSQTLSVENNVAVSRSEWLTSGSFILLNDIDVSQLGISFITAIKQRYQAKVITTSCDKLYSSSLASTLEELNEPSKTALNIKNNPFEIIGIKEAETYFRNTQHLESLDVDSYFIHSFIQELDKVTIKEKCKTSSNNAVDNLPFFPFVKYVCLARGLLSSISHVFSIIDTMPQLRILILSYCRFSRGSDQIKQRPLPSTCLNDILTVESWTGLQMNSNGIHDGTQQNSMIKELGLQSTGIEWIDVYHISSRLKNVEYLDLSNNRQLFDGLSERWLQYYILHSHQDSIVVSVKDHFFPKLQSLNVQNNHITGWVQFILICIVFPTLTTIACNQNALGNLNSLQALSEALLETYQYTCSVETLKIYFSRIISLQIENNQITSWETFSILSMVCTELESLRWLGNPLTGLSLLPYPTRQQLPLIELAEQDSSPTTAFSSSHQQLARQMIIALFSKIQILNGSNVSQTERQHAELYFLSLAARDVWFIKNLDPKKYHQHRLELQHTTGLFNPCYRCIDKEIKQIPSTFDIELIPDLLNHGEPLQISCKLNEMKLCDTPKVTRTVPLWLKIRDLKLLCQKLFHYPASRLKLLLILSKNQLYSGIHLVDDECSLQYYGISQGSRIIIQTVQN